MDSLRNKQQSETEHARLRLLLGRARSGKTARMIAEIRELVHTGQGRALVLVPEQYSHEAERELCSACGDRLSLHAEVMSFTGFARWGRAVYGGVARRWMDQGGKLLCMAVALRELRPMLSLYGKASENPELQAAMVRELDTIRLTGAGAQSLRELAPELDGELRVKVLELATVTEAYEAVMRRSGAESEDPLSLLAGQIEKNGLTEFDRVYVDGFLDFTGLELRVLSAVMKRGVPLTVLLPGTQEGGSKEHLLISTLTAARLTELARDAGLAAETYQITDADLDGREPDRIPDTLNYFTEHMFDYGAAPAAPEAGRIALLSAESPALECEAAAAEVLRAVRDDGLRWRDVAVAARGFSDYRCLLESTFRRYGIPLFVTRRDPLSEKPLTAWIASAYELILGDWDPDVMTAYLRCGFSGLDEETCDALCTYLFRWRLKAPAWLGKRPWRQHPGGYGRPRTEESDALLRDLNRARECVAAPLLLLKERCAAATDAAGQVSALRDFLEAAKIPVQLTRRIRQLEADGEAELRAEYLQLWEILSGAMTQMAAVLGSMPMDAQLFSRLLKALLNCYDIGLIPISLDRVLAGDFDRMRRRNIRRLIVLGCCEGRLPAGRSAGGLFTQEERDRLAEMGLAVGGGEGELWREYALIYHTLSLPRERLVLCCPETDLDGAPQTPALVWDMAKRIFSIQPEKQLPQLLRLNAPAPALGLALSRDPVLAGPTAGAAARWFLAHDKQRFERLREAVVPERGTLSPEAVKALYGPKLRISPSRLEVFSSCRFRYYCRYGMKAEPAEPYGFQPPEIGTFTHFVLEKTGRTVKELGGFAAVTNAQLKEITDHHIQAYIHEELGDYAEKSARFRQLFERHCADVQRIVLDTAEELRSSDFVPLSFELDMASLPSAHVGAEQGAVHLTGIADRVDGFRGPNGLKLRVVDYKTGKKQFQLYDVLYGRNLQMLLYLFSVCDNAEELYGEAADPAGIVYLPARESMLQFDGEPDSVDEEARRRKEKRRSGLILSDPAILAAWEHGPDQQYMPQKTRIKDPFVSRDQFMLLRRQAVHCLNEMRAAVAAGRIEANPSWESENENACRNCDYYPVCGFIDGENGEHSRVIRKFTDAEVWQQLQPQDGEEA